MSNKDHQTYIQVLKNRGSEKRLMKVFELSELTKQLFIYGLRKRYKSISKTDSTKEVANEMVKVLNENNLLADVTAVSEVKSLLLCSAVVIDAPINGMSWLPGAKVFLEKKLAYVYTILDVVPTVS